MKRDIATMQVAEINVFSKFKITDMEIDVKILMFMLKDNDSFNYYTGLMFPIKLPSL